ncbi:MULTISPECIES: hypothetical protein [Serratia]|uniref:hypothetical protein n=1 Tax=Serratia TaxID=613 RepID=UPI001F4C31BA|nr:MULTISPECIES: hypothetical protein [Serratia]ULG11032.1 anion permease [Serratia entomophila]CAI1954548.1 Uncharacterised protein [Serratia quinivorans]CAI2159063.1 Uncharacterised protein [Serratia quinivorans]
MGLSTSLSYVIADHIAIENTLLLILGGGGLLGLAMAQRLEKNERIINVVFSITHGDGFHDVNQRPLME